MQKQFAKESQLIVEMSIAKELGMTLTRLRSEITYAELQLWVLFFNHQNELQEKAMQKARRR